METRYERVERDGETFVKIIDEREVRLDMLIEQRTMLEEELAQVNEKIDAIR